IINTAIAPPQPTTEMNLSVNLDSREVPPPAFDILNPSATSNYRTTVDIFDSQGNAHSVTTFFRKDSANTWAAHVTIPGADASPVSANPFVQVGAAIPLTFDTFGVQTAPAGPVNVSFDFNGGVALGQVVALDFGTTPGSDPTTQLAEDSTVNSFDQDGFAPGTLSAISMGLDGFIAGQFSNGEIINLAQVALADFPNVEGLLSIGNNNLIESPNSGQPLFGEPQTGGLGSTNSGSLEQSAVDLAAQFVKMIINQRAFQANTRTVSTTNELLANLVSLGQ
ncbi:MAG: flagellar hook-basal body complex protein, partial [Proteobacteria bacterium]|nr:flagellar hook-basal body complex protein [Pseudomonadota bacterium]